MTHGLKQMFKTRQHQLQKRRQKQDVGITCKGNKLRWWIKIKKKCQKAYGRDSKWDRDAQDGKCADAWSKCITGFYAVCCSNPVGPKNTEAYCAKQNLTFHNANSTSFDKDKLCQVQESVRGVQDIMRGIKDTVKLMDVVATPLALGPGPVPLPAPAPAPALAPPGLVAQPPAPAPAAPVPVPMASPLVDRCAMLKELTRQAHEKIKAIKSWAQQDGMTDDSSSVALLQVGNPRYPLLPESPEDDIQELKKNMDVEHPEAKDPDLVFSVKGVISAGEKLDGLLKHPNFCDMREDEDDDDDDTVEEDLAYDPVADSSDDEEEEEEEVKEVKQVTVNYTAIGELLDWEFEMEKEVDKFDKDVHPHGFKWWRYRYEYTLIESLVLAFSVMVKYIVMMMMHGLSYFNTNKFYKTGVTKKLYRYAWAYLVFHAAVLMVMVTIAYMLYMPWGKQNIFDIFGQYVRNLVGDRANVPFLGYSWLYMVLDVQFQLFVCFVLYALFVFSVASNYQRALEDWKALSENMQDPSVKAINAQRYKAMNDIMKKRVQNTPEYRQIFHELKLRLPGVVGLDSALPGWYDFSLHLYLTDGLGKSIEYLVQVSLTTNIFLACSALVVALLAHHYEVAFMYFLPGFLVLGSVLFLAGHLISRHFRALSDNDDHNTPAKYVTVHSYCRSIQILLYFVFFSFSRLLLSNDIFEFYPKVYFLAVVGLLVVLALLAFVAGELIKETACALILPPHIPQDQFKKYLEQVVLWHTSDKCHECGAQQWEQSLSQEWAGKKPLGERDEKSNAPDSTRRQFSWRG